MARQLFRRNRPSGDVKGSGPKSFGRLTVDRGPGTRRGVVGSGLSAFPSQSGLDLVLGTIEARYSRR